MKYKLDCQKRLPQMGDLVIIKTVAHPQRDEIVTLYGEKETECGDIENILFFTEHGAFKIVYRVFNDNNNGLFIETVDGSVYQVLRTIPNQNLEIREI